MRCAVLTKMFAFSKQQTAMIHIYLDLLYDRKDQY